MLLKNIALTYAERRLAGRRDQPVPILLELNRLNETDQSIEAHLVEILSLNEFPHAENFVNVGLEKGNLLLLFDGLDEVNSANRGKVVKKITDLLDTHEGCRAVMTCRTAVYNNEFSDTVDQTMEIVEFSDQQIRNFLSTWQEEMPVGKTIEQLLQTLRDRPQRR